MYIIHTYGTLINFSNKLHLFLLYRKLSICKTTQQTEIVRFKYLINKKKMKQIL